MRPIFFRAFGRNDRAVEAGLVGDLTDIRYRLRGRTAYSLSSHASLVPEMAVHRRPAKSILLADTARGTLRSGYVSTRRPEC